MQRGHAWTPMAAQERKVKVAGMKVNDIEPRNFLEHELHQPYMVRQRVQASAILPKGLPACRNQPGAGLGISACEKRDSVALANQLLGKIGHDTLRATIPLRRNT